MTIGQLKIANMIKTIELAIDLLRANDEDFTFEDEDSLDIIRQLWRLIDDHLTFSWAEIEDGENFKFVSAVYEKDDGYHASHIDCIVQHTDGQLFRVTLRDGGFIGPITFECTDEYLTPVKDK